MNYSLFIIHYPYSLLVFPPSTPIFTRKSNVAIFPKNLLSPINKAFSGEKAENSAQSKIAFLHRVKAMSAEIPIDCYVGQSREWLKALETKLLSQIAGGGRVITSETDGGLSVSYKVAGTPQQNLRAVRYALNGRTAEDLSTNTSLSSTGEGRGFCVPAGFAAERA